MGFDITSALIVMGGLGLLFGAGLAVASKIFAVEKDQRTEDIAEILPGANCGACGAPGCAGFADGVVSGKYEVSGCPVGGADTAGEIAKIMGLDAGTMVAKVAVVRCRGDHDNAVDRAIYYGIKDCKAATLIDNGSKGCEYGCLGMGNCVDVCLFDAMIMADNGLPVVDELKCTGCGACVSACPRGIMELIPKDQEVFIACVSKDFGKAVKAVCTVGCIGCSMCSKEKITPNEIITMDGKLPVINYDKINDQSTDLNNAVAKCPTKSFGTRGGGGEGVVIENKIEETAAV
ncbi:RnfABCDGE type electron transport complex subunit B [bacterium]|nr:RnfABCDGE type electron transport complex subunit B [bacterium]